MGVVLLLRCGSLLLLWLQWLTGIILRSALVVVGRQDCSLRSSFNSRNNETNCKERNRPSGIELPAQQKSGAGVYLVFVHKLRSTFYGVACQCMVFPSVKIYNTQPLTGKLLQLWLWLSIRVPVV